MRLFAGTEWDQPPKCEKCGLVDEDCQCPPDAPPQEPPVPPEEQTARLAIEKRKKGKKVTAVRGLATRGNALPKLLSELKNSCGAGGSIQDDVIEIQGEQLERVRKVLVSLGYRVKG